MWNKYKKSLRVSLSAIVILALIMMGIGCGNNKDVSVKDAEQSQILASDEYSSKESSDDTSSSIEDNKEIPEEQKEADNSIEQKEADNSTEQNDQKKDESSNAASLNDKGKNQGSSIKDNNDNSSIEDNSSVSQSQNTSNNSSVEPEKNNENNNDVSVGDDNKKPDEDNKKEEQYCTIEIRCDTILNNKDELKEGKEKYVPSNGVILSSKKVKINDGDNVFDVLKRIASESGIALSATNDPFTGAYVRGINNIFEKDCGGSSGWMYKVNGKIPSVSCSKYKLKPGDAIKWQYTCSFGSDL